jgi:tRNA nucleotidyltransferase (CCA-adding enzyme)
VKIITTHLSADFDAFAAAVCSVRLFPDSRVLFPGSQEAAVRRFLTDTELDFPELKLRQARTEKIEHAVVVDTRSPARLGEVHGLITRAGCPITLIDHHMEEEEDGLSADEVFERPVGATCTIIAELFRERSIEPTAEEASLLLMGIYEDTGGLSYRETTPEDLRVGAWLIEQGASLAWVRRWVLKALQPEQLELLNRMVEATEEIDIAGVPVALAMVEVDRYHEEAAFVVHRWIEIFDISVGAVMLVRPPNINLILRSHLPGLHVGRVAQRFGGGGHPTAASARISGAMPVEVREQLLDILAIEMPPPATAIDIAARTIFSVDDTNSVEETKDRINQLRVNALPVRDAEDELVGLVTRQILDRALSHGMAERPVRSIMQPELPIVSAATPLDELGDLFLERSLRFVVVEDAGRPAGIITRMELFRRLFEHQYAAGSTLDHRMAGTRPVSQQIARKLRENAPAWVQRLLAAAGRVADAQRVSVYLVGGMVRDLLLGRVNEDVDLVVEGDGIAFSSALADALDGRHHPHAPFLTAVVSLPDGLRVDVASARTEFYRTPAALPEVITSLIRQDLYRRDFTINSLAIALSGDSYGELVDFFGGRKDIDRKEIRVLHSLSFIDDPTRALRAVRYSRRLGFTIATDTRNLITTALGEGVFERLSGQRLRRELEYLLEEPHPTLALALVADLGLLPAICPEFVWSEEVRSYLMEIEGQLAWYQLERLGPPPERWILYLGGLARCAGSGAEHSLVHRLQLAGTDRRQFLSLLDEISTIRQAADGSVPLSRRVEIVEECSAEALLLAMASLPLEAGRAVAEAAEAAVRVSLPVSGRQLVDAGIPPGPHIGRTLKLTRDALIDGVMRDDEALTWALETARCLQTEEKP